MLELKFVSNITTYETVGPDTNNQITDWNATRIQLKIITAPQKFTIISMQTHAQLLIEINITLAGPNSIHMCVTVSLNRIILQMRARHHGPQKPIDFARPLLDRSKACPQTPISPTILRRLSYPICSNFNPMRVLMCMCVCGTHWILTKPKICYNFPNRRDYLLPLLSKHHALMPGLAWQSRQKSTDHNNHFPHYACVLSDFRPRDGATAGSSGGTNFHLSSSPNKPSLDVSLPHTLIHSQRARILCRSDDAHTHLYESGLEAHMRRDKGETNSVMTTNVHKHQEWCTYVCVGMHTWARTPLRSAQRTPNQIFVTILLFMGSTGLNEAVFFVFY